MSSTSAFGARDLTAEHWTQFAALARPRAFARAVSLPTGEILVIGGLDREDPRVTNDVAELVDPLSRYVKELPQPLVGRLNQTLTVSGRERVVAAGGVTWSGSQWEPTDRVEVFDVRSRRWSSGAPMLATRASHAAVALDDGRVVVIGGNRDTRLLASVESYNVETGTWSALAPMPQPRTQHAAVMLRDGRVLVVGGVGTDGATAATTFLYDPRSNMWSFGPRTLQPRLQASVILLSSGDVLLAGGGGPSSGSSELYLASENRFVMAGSLLHPRFVAQSAALPDGRAVLAGGLPARLDVYRPMTSSEVWDPVTRTWADLPSTNVGRAWGMLVFSEGALYLIGGTGEGESSLGTIERFQSN